MSTQKSFAMTKEKIKSILLDDKHRSADDIAKHILKRRKKHGFNPPEHLRDKFDIEGVGVVSKMHYHMRPKGVKPTKMFFYIHGGGYSFEITKAQWEFVAKCVEQNGFEAIVPIYPLAPENDARKTFDMLTECYKNVTTSSDIDRLVLVGDNSGAGLALSLAVLAWENGLRRPDKLVLISPVLDTEFMDRNMENILLNKSKETYKHFYRPAIKDYLRKYWIKDLYHENAYTCPLYADLTDICDEMTIYTVEDDLLNVYARALYEEIKKQQIRIHFYEFFGVPHNFIEHMQVPECASMVRKVSQSIKDEAKHINSGIHHSVWARSMVAERYPRLYEDDESIKLASKIGTSHKEINATYSEYDRLVTMSRLLEIDKRVKSFIKRYADSVIVNVGSELDTMFARMDNGRIRWYNVDMPEIMELRRKYMEPRDREQNIEKSILDMSWLDSVKKEPGQAILFVCADMTKLLTNKRLQSFVNAVWTRFPGAEIIFDVKNNVGKKKHNFNVLTGKKNGSFIKVSIDNCTSLMYDWNIKYRVLYDEAILNANDVEDMYSEAIAKRYRRAIRRKYDKIIQLKLGTERAIENL